jgi:hypothetical protein
MSEELAESAGEGWSQRRPGLLVGERGYDLPEVVKESLPAGCCCARDGTMQRGPW